MVRTRLKIKPGAELDGLTIEAIGAIVACLSVWTLLKREWVTITEGTGAKHEVADSAHTVDYEGDEYYGYAIDVRTRDLPGGCKGEMAARAASYLRSTLGGAYDVVLHDTHIHIEYDKRALNL